MSADTTLNAQLIAAIAVDDAPMCARLITEGADVNTMERHGDELQGTLQVAVSRASRNALALLLARGASPSLADELGITALHTAAHGSDVEMCRILLNAGADPCFKSNSGKTPLHYAATGGSTQACKMLIAKGADIHHKDNFGRTAALWAVDGGQVALVRDLVAMGGRVDGADNLGVTGLHRAAKTENVPMFLCLMDLGADPSTQNHAGRTPLKDAIYAGKYAICAALVRSGVPHDGIIEYCSRSPHRTHLPLIQAAANEAAMAARIELSGSPAQATAARRKPMGL